MLDFDQHVHVQIMMVECTKDMTLMCHALVVIIDMCTVEPAK